MIDLRRVDTRTIIECLPENRALYKDSGLWNVLDDEDNPICEQGVNETFRDFIVRYGEMCLEEDKDEEWGFAQDIGMAILYRKKPGEVV